MTSEKRRPGRPPLPADQKRQNRIFVYVDKAECEAVKSAAARHSVSVNEYVRRAVTAAMAEET